MQSLTEFCPPRKQREIYFEANSSENPIKEMFQEDGLDYDRTWMVEFLGETIPARILIATNSPCSIVLKNHEIQLFHTEKELNDVLYLMCSAWELEDSSVYGKIENGKLVATHAQKAFCIAKILANTFLEIKKIYSQYPNDVLRYLLTMDDQFPANDTFVDLRIQCRLAYRILVKYMQGESPLNYIR